MFVHLFACVFSRFEAFDLINLLHKLFEFVLWLGEMLSFTVAYKSTDANANMHNTGFLFDSTSLSLTETL